MRPLWHGRAMLGVAVVSAACLAGCAYSGIPRIDPTGERIFAPPPAKYEPQPEGRREWDNVSLVLTPRERIAPVGSEVALLAGVVGPDRYTSTNERVEWSVAPGSVGEIVRVGEGTFCDLMLLDFTRPHKVHSTFAVTSTSRKHIRLTRGSKATDDDVLVQPGQAWITVSSATEGTSYVTAYAPSVYGWAPQRETAAIHWVDAQWTFPPPAINPAGTRHVFTTTVSRHTNQDPHVGWIVRYEIAAGPAAGFAPDGAKTVEVATNQLGQASVEIFQPQPAPGTNRIDIQVIRPATHSGPEGKRLIVGTGSTTKTWSAPQIAVRKTGPNAVAVGGTIRYVIEVSNPGDQPADGVVVADQVPEGTTVLGSRPAALTAGRQLQWQIGQLPAGQARRLEVDLRAERLGTLQSCAEAAAAGGLRTSDCATTTVTAPGIEVKVTGPAQVAVGEQARFDIVVTNRGQATASGLVVRDRFDPGLRPVPATDRIEVALPGAVPGTLAPGASQPVHVTFQAVQAGQLCHTVEILGAGGVLASQQACVTAVPRGAPPPPQPKPEAKPEPKPAPAEKPAAGAAISVTKTGPTSAAKGDMVVFTIEIANTGTQRLTDVTVVDESDPQLRPNRATGQTFKTQNGRLTPVVFAEMLPGAKVVLQVEYECLEAGAKVCTSVRVATAEGARNQAEACLAIAAGAKPGAALGPPDLQIAISDSSNPVSVGREYYYRISVTNNGQTAETNVVVMATVPPSLTVDQLKSGPKAQASGQQVTFGPLLVLRPGQTETFRLVVSAKTPGRVEVTAQVAGRATPQPRAASKATDINRAP